MILGVIWERKGDYVEGRGVCSEVVFVVRVVGRLLYIFLNLQLYI